MEQSITITLNENELAKLKVEDISDKEQIANALHQTIDALPEPVLESDREEATAWLKSEVKELLYGKTTAEVSPSSYDDRISASTILKAFNEYKDNKDIQKDYECFANYLESEVYEEMMCNGTFDSIADDLKNNLESKLLNQPEALQNAVAELVEEDGSYNAILYTAILDIGGYEGCTIDLEAFLEEDYHINLMFATERERDCDMGSIKELFNSDISGIGRDMLNSKEVFDNTADNALSYLIHQQGYEIANIIEEIHRPDDAKAELDNSFIGSVVSELDNQTYCMSELTALVTASGKNLLELLDNIASGKDFISLPKETEIGLFNEWNGSGSCLEIQLDKPAVFPAEMVRNVQFEGRGMQKENDGYTVDEVYGLIGSVWEKGEASITTEAPVLKEENLEKAQGKLKEYAKEEKTGKQRNTEIER